MHSLLENLRLASPRDICDRGARLSAILAFTGLFFLALPSLAEDWSLAKQAEGIDIYTRPVAGSGIKQFKGIADFEAPAEKIVALLRDSDRFKDWFPNTPESKLLNRKDHVSYQYSVLDAPWPVSDRDNVLRSVLTKDESTGAIEIQVTAAPDFYPDQTDRVRVRTANGFWKIEPLDANRSRVTFSMHIEPGGGIPEWLTNSRVVETPYEALTNLRVSASR